jgi:chromate transporter
LVLGCTSFGGPVAHIGFFREAFVAKRRWLDDATFSSYLALCQFIPGPASSQLGMAVGYHRAGFIGAFSAWLAFTLPSAILLAAFAVVLGYDSNWMSGGVVHGLKLVALAVVIHAFLGMQKSLAPDVKRILLMMLSVAVFVFWQSIFAPISVLVLVGVICAIVKMGETESESAAPPTSSDSQRIAKPYRIAYVMLALFLSGFVAQWFADGQILDQFLAYYRAGSLVFGGGHVVLPLLETEIVGSGWVNRDTFLAGYGAAQAVPGPLFTFASFLGASHEVGVNGYPGALLATVAIFLPSFLLLFGVLPFWQSLQHHQRIKAALWGVNAAVLGLLLATIFDPILTQTISGFSDVLFAATAFALLYFGRVSVVLVVLCGGALGGAIL